MKKEHLWDELIKMEQENERASNTLDDTCILTDYEHLAKNGIWTYALRASLNEHETVIVPPSDTPYIIDDTIAIPSNRKIIAYGATFLSASGTDVLMMRNEHNVDGTHMPVNREKDER